MAAAEAAEAGTLVVRLAGGEMPGGTVLDRLIADPLPGRGALERAHRDALGRGPSDGVDRLVLYNAVLALLRAAAVERPLLDAVRDLTGQVVGWSAPGGFSGLLQFCHYAAGLVAAGAGDFEVAYRHTMSISPIGQVSSHVGLARWAVLDLVEAATRTGRHAEAAAHVAAFRQARVADLSPRAAMLVHAAAAVAATDRADELFRRALAVPEAQTWPFAYARVQLLYGEHLRRARSATAARGPLGAALAAFDGLGATPWSHRAGAELRAAGGTDHDGGSAAAAGLTPQENEVVTLAAAGLTDNQIAQRLQLSRRTVDSHLYRAFAKLKISNRAALGAALAARPGTARSSAPGCPWFGAENSTVT